MSDELPLIERVNYPNILSLENIVSLNILWSRLGAVQTLPRTGRVYGRVTALCYKMVKGMKCGGDV